MGKSLFLQYITSSARLWVTPFASHLLGPFIARLLSSVTVSHMPYLNFFSVLKIQARIE